MFIIIIGYPLPFFSPTLQRHVWYGSSMMGAIGKEIFMTATSFSFLGLWDDFGYFALLFIPFWNFVLGLLMSGKLFDLLFFFCHFFWISDHRLLDGCLMDPFWIFYFLNGWAFTNKLCSLDEKDIFLPRMLRLGRGGKL